MCSRFFSFLGGIIETYPLICTIVIGENLVKMQNIKKM